MKKTILIVGVVVSALAVLGIGTAFAQGPAPFGGNGMVQHGAGYLHTYMVTALAEKLDLSVEDVNARLAAGDTMYDIAIADGVKPEDVTALLIEIRASALSAAVKDGIITQEQANWMSSRGFGRGGFGTGNCPMQNGQGIPLHRGGGFGPGMMGGAGWQNQQTNP